MRLFRHYEHLPAGVCGGAVAIGNFDGVHLGHRAVIGEAGRIARSAGVPWSVLTLEPHPRSVFDPAAAPFRLTPFHAKARLIEALGVEVLVVVPFDRDFASRSAREFVRNVLVEGIAARFVVSGHNFAFGHGREGTPELLLQLGGEFGFDYTCVREVRDPGGEPYSSTRVRRCLAAGDLDGARQLLGRPFEIEGRVVDGDRRGRTIGFPTANVRLGDYARPLRGVYAVRVGIGDGADYDGVANLGIRPSFGGTEDLLEVHLFDFDGDLYGRHLRVDFIHFIRAEKKFDGIDALKAQITADAAAARERLAAADALTNSRTAER
jgi:riboflavin kinase / FMN adenylyltransferase